MSQCADALQVLLERRTEGRLSRAQLRGVAADLAADINRTQDRNRRAREAHRRRRLRELRQRGVKCSALPCCDVEVAL